MKKTKIIAAIIAIMMMIFILGCTATEVSKVNDADAVKSTAQPITEKPPLTDEQILAKYDDGLDEAMKELDEAE